MADAIVIFHFGLFFALLQNDTASLTQFFHIYNKD